MVVNVEVTVYYSKEIDDSLYDSNNLRKYPSHWSLDQIKGHLMASKKEVLESSIYDVTEDLEHTDYEVIATIKEQQQDA